MHLAGLYTSWEWKIIRVIELSELTNNPESLNYQSLSIIRAGELFYKLEYLKNCNSLTCRKLNFEILNIRTSLKFVNTPLHRFEDLSLCAPNLNCVYILPTTLCFGQQH